VRALGYAASRITSLFDDHLLEITLTTILAYGSYLLAEQLHVSAVLSVVAAGVVIGNYGSRTGMSAAPVWQSTHSGNTWHF
jgi:CPA1 family monovalent cation:H+ antiporter